MAVNQNDIIQATIRCAYQYSLPEVTVKLIGKESGIKGQGLYNHFESKMDILVACFNYCDRNDIIYIHEICNRCWDITDASNRSCGFGILCRCIVFICDWVV